MNQSLCCPYCNDEVVKSFNDTIKVRNKTIRIEENGVYAICKGCDAKLPIPLKLDVDLAKSIATDKKLRLIVKKG